MQPSADRETARWIRESERQDFASEDLADPQILNRIIWFSVRGSTKAYPTVARMPAFDVMRTISDEESAEQLDLNRQMKTFLAQPLSQTRANLRTETSHEISPFRPDALK